MTANGINGSSRSDLHWKVGLVNSAGKFLTAESFGFKVNVSGTSLKKKQIFILEQDSHEEVVYIKSYLERYMSADKYGKVTCESEERGQTEKFVVEYDKNGSGRWAFKNVVHGNFLGGSDDNFKCFSKSVTESELWMVNLAIHPQVNVQNVNRKRYACVKNEELQATEVIPWGPESVIILHFDNGKYALKTFDNRFLNKDGTLSTELSEDSRFCMEIRGGSNSGFAFKDCSGLYLTAVGSAATMKGRNKTVSKDELFTLENSCPQVVLTSLSNNKKISIRQGAEQRWGDPFAMKLKLRIPDYQMWSESFENEVTKSEEKLDYFGLQRMTHLGVTTGFGWHTTLRGKARRIYNQITTGTIRTGTLLR